jgi:hypothetical protein
MKSFLVAIALGSALMLSACGTVGNALSSFSGRSIEFVDPSPNGASVEQEIYAYAKSYSVAANEAADLIEADTTPVELKNVLAKAVKTSAPLVKTATYAAEQYGMASAKIKARHDANEDVPTVYLNDAADALFAMQRAYAESKPEVEQLLALIASLRS